MSYELNLVKIEDTSNKKNLLKALKKVASIDDFFMGYDSDECLWECAKDEGFKTNVDYVINKVREIKDDVELVEEFLKLWLDDDGFCESYEFKYILDENKHIESLAIVIEFED